MRQQTGGTPIIRKKIHQGKIAQEKLTKGINIVADIIKQTLCPKGKNVIVRQSSYLQPRSMNDGHYIAQNIQSDDPTINAGMDMIKQICANTNDRVGDGTTTTAILCQELINGGFKEIAKGKNPIDIKNEINQEAKNAIAHLKSISKPLKTLDDIENIATISGNNDKDIGQAIRKIKEKLGWEAPIITERHDKTELDVKCVKGLYLKEGYRECRAFVDNFNKKTAELKGGLDDKVKVLCLDEEMNDINDMQAFIAKVSQEYQEKQKPTKDFKILIIAKEASPEAAPVAFMAMNNTAILQNQMSTEGAPIGFRNCIIEAPRSMGYQPDILEDIALATNAQVVGQRTGLRLRDVKPSQVLGQADKIIVNRETTIIIGGLGDKDRIKKHINGLEDDLKQERLKEKKESLEARINMLGAGIGIIKAGGITTVEAKERELRLEDAILAVKAAIEEGLVVGGGNAYYQIANNINSNILKNACLAVPKQIAVNSGKEYNADKVDGNIGFNALTGEYEDLIKAGIIDATKVVRVALENAVSFSSLLLTTSASIIEYEEQN